MTGMWASQAFADQFEEEGDYYLFRPEEDGPAIRVSAEEQQAFIAEYNRYLYISTFGVIAAMIAMTALIAVILIPVGLMDYFLEAFFTGLVLLMIVTIPFSRRAFDAPRRALSGRAPVVERTYRDMRQ